MDALKKLINQQLDSNITVWFILDKNPAKQYEVSQFKIGFFQAVDHKGQPQQEVHGGQVLLTLTEAVGEDIYGWAMREYEKQSGVITFKVESASAPMRILFTNAYCVSFKRYIDCVGGGLYTSLVLSPEELNINGVEHDNFWK